MKVLSVLGTRPEAIKLAPILRKLRDAGPSVVSTLVTTAQHRELGDDVLGFFELRADHDLGVMTTDQTPSEVAARVLVGIQGVLAAERPDWVVVQGDTTTTMAAALAAFHSGFRVAHVEAGLRTGHRREPFPEEVNRRIVTLVSDLHFAPTPGAADVLRGEGVPETEIVVTGNPVIDALEWAVPRATAPPDLVPDVERLVLVTAHRRESFGEGLASICEALLEICRRFAGRVGVVFPVHPNPNVEGPVRRILGGHPAIRLVPPLSYPSLVALLGLSFVVLTDSGGLQEEAPSLGKPVLVLRSRTERPEAVRAGTARLVGTDTAAIVSAFGELWDSPEAYRRMARATNPYGDGRAAERIVAALQGKRLRPFAPG